MNFCCQLKFKRSTSADVKFTYRWKSEILFWPYAVENCERKRNEVGNFYTLLSAITNNYVIYRLLRNELMRYLEDHKSLIRLREYEG